MSGRLLLVFLIWSGCAAAGITIMLRYEHSPGASGQPVAFWPSASALVRPGDRPTLVAFIHPHCPCSRASITELTKLLESNRADVQTHVVFVKPQELPADWEKTDLWARASRIPGVIVSCDESGAEAQLFGAETSGAVLFYNSTGELAFSGGITPMRGHEGDSAGKHTLTDLLANQPTALSRTAVYGCDLGTCCQN